MERQKRGFKGLLTAILLGCFCLSFITVHGEETDRPTITVESISVDREEEILVPIRVSGNPGICYAILSVEYSEGLRLLEAQDAGLLSDPVFGNDLEANPYRLSWDDSMASGNNTANGTLVTLRFALEENAGAGVYTVKVNYDENNLFDLDFRNVRFDTVEGRIEITEKQDFPVIAVAIGVGLALIVLCVVILIGKKRRKAEKNGSSESANAKE